MTHCEICKEEEARMSIEGRDLCPACAKNHLEGNSLNSKEDELEKLREENKYLHGALSRSARAVNAMADLLLDLGMSRMVNRIRGME